MKAKPKSKNGKKHTVFRNIIILILIFIAIMVFAFITPVFNITEIEIKGNSKVSTETIESLSGLHIGENLFRNSKKQIINNIKEDTYIKDVNIKRKMPETIEISVTERTVEYQINVINGYIYIDNQGYILEKASKKAKVPLLEGYKTSQDSLLNVKRLSEEDLGKLTSTLKIIEAMKSIEKQNLITSINIENEDEYILYLEKEKKYIYLGDASNLSNKMLYIQTILEKEKKNTGIIFINGDLNDGFKPYFREENIEKNNEEEKNENE